MIDIAYIKNNGLLLIECISGSKAYGLDTPQSDTDIKGVFILPRELYFGLEYIPQVADVNNDRVYYEIGRFTELLIKNNPTIIELLGTSDEFILHKDPLMDLFKKRDFLSKLCKDTFAGYAFSQIKKAQGLNKKIVNPVEKKRKSVLDFCFVNYDKGSVELKKFLELRNWKQEDCGLVAIPHMRYVYGLYHNPDLNYSGLVRSEDSNEVALSSIPKSAKQVAIMYFNKDGYSVYCKKYKQYWDWVQKRNESRYENTKSHGKNYDSKNMMHTFRLLEMAKEIGEKGEINTHRNDREFLFKIKSGAFEYEELIEMAENKLVEIDRIFELSSLPAESNEQILKEVLIKIRNEFYIQ